MTQHTPHDCAIHPTACSPAPEGVKVLCSIFRDKHAVEKSTYVLKLERVKEDKTVELVCALMMVSIVSRREGVSTGRPQAQDGRRRKLRHFNGRDRFFQRRVVSGQAKVSVCSSVEMLTGIGRTLSARRSPSSTTASIQPRPRRRVDPTAASSLPSSMSVPKPLSFFIYLCANPLRCDAAQEFNPLGFWGPRKMTVLLPGMDEHQRPLAFSPPSVRPTELS